MNRVAFIGFASGWGAQIRETEKGPASLFNSRILDNLPFPWEWKETLLPLKTAQEIDLPSGSLTLLYIKDLCHRIALSVKNSLERHRFPVIIGEDHTAAIGTWAGIADHFKEKEEMGLIWIDAHMDSHTLDTTPSQAYHGMPLAILLGFGEPSLVHLLGKRSVLKPQHVCLIGVRSYEDGEAALLKRLGVRIYFMEEILIRGFKTILEEALQYVKKNTKSFGLSIDLDAFDPLETPGVGTPEPHGLKAKDVLPSLSMIQKDPGFKALEIVEYNPDQDKDGKTLLLMKNLLLHLLPQGQER